MNTVCEYLQSLIPQRERNIRDYYAIQIQNLTQRTESEDVIADIDCEVLVMNTCYKVKLIVLHGHEDMDLITNLYISGPNIRGKYDGYEQLNISAVPVMPE